jgi:hypothetical protein
MSAKSSSRASLDAKLRLRQLIRNITGVSDPDIIINRVFYVMIALSFVYYLNYAFYPNPPLFNKDIDPIFEYRDAYRATGRLVERDDLASYSYRQIPSKQDKTKEIDLCPIILSTASRRHPNWLWLAQDLKTEDVTEGPKQARLSNPIVLWREGGGPSVSGMPKKLIDQLEQHGDIETIHLGQYSTSSDSEQKRAEEFEDHMAAWKTCAERATSCRYCLILDDAFEVAENDFRRFLYEVLVLADRNSLDWGVVSLNPVPPQQPWIDGFRAPLIILSLLALYISNRSARAGYLDHTPARFIGLMLIIFAIWVLFYQPKTLVPPPKIVSYWYPTPFHGNAYMIKPKDGSVLISKARSSMPELRHSVNNLLVRYFRSRGRGDLKMLTGSLRPALEPV